MRNSFIIIAVLLVAIGCGKSPDQQTLEGYEIANKWADMALYLSKNTGANSPTYASRALGYTGLVMYESVVAADPSYRSLQGQLNDAGNWTNPESFEPALALNAGQATILKLVYNQTIDLNKAKVDSLENEIYKLFSKGMDKDLVSISVEHGREIANSIFEWSLSDGGHRAYLKNFDKDWTHPEYKGSWKPPLFAQSFSHHPLHPHWGQNRTFLRENSNLVIPDYLTYNTAKDSEYYQQFLEVYEKDLTLTQEEKEAALWWGDDPDDTFTPPGHSYFIAKKTIEHFKPDMVKASQTYALVGISVADAFINCWKWKYHHFTERANTYIPTNIDESWESFWPDPPFPSFPSGHAMNAGAAATALTALYGNDFEFIDDSHVGRERDEVRKVDFVARKFSSFWEMAEEIADSRFYGGIHIPYDNEVGLAEGKRVAENVSNLKWKNDD